jgi:phosphoribosylformylglycinamidine cyclo-ligase
VPVADRPAGKGGAPRTAYAAAGVDVAAGDMAVDLMLPAIESTRRSEVVPVAGGFGGAVAIPAGYRDPLIVASTDGVGTKTAIAAALGRWETIGRDLVAMCADDVVCCGAEPLAMLDYVAVGRLDPDEIAALVGGVADGCREAGCALIGGETAEHPGLMPPGTFDLAGTCIGVVERDALLDGQDARVGDVIVGLPSSGLHANGYSLVRSVIDAARLGLDLPYQEALRLGLAMAEDRRPIAVESELQLATLGEVLLTPTRIYAPAVLRARAILRDRGLDLRGVAHITGGGLPGNLPRALPAGLGAVVDPSRWPMPTVMCLVGGLGNLGDAEIRATFNGGIGMALVVPHDGPALDELLAGLAADGHRAVVVGTVVQVQPDEPRYREAELP